MNKTMNSFNLLFTLIILSMCNAQKNSTRENAIANSKNWSVEQQSRGKENFKTNSLEIIDAKSYVVWFKKNLAGSIRTEYDITISCKNESYHNVSAMNCFCVANDPNYLNDFFKEKKQTADHFPNYHHLKLYYVGYGGHHNTKTRFGWYNEDTEVSLLSEYDHSCKVYIIMANKKSQIGILAKDNHTTYGRDRKVIFEVYDTEPYKKAILVFKA